MGSVNDIIVDAGRMYVFDKDDRVAALSADAGVSLCKQSDL